MPEILTDEQLAANYLQAAAKECVEELRAETPGSTAFTALQTGYKGSVKVLMSCYQRLTAEIHQSIINGTFASVTEYVTKTIEGAVQNRAMCRAVSKVSGAKDIYSNWNKQQFWDELYKVGLNKGFSLKEVRAEGDRYIKAKKRERDLISAEITEMEVKKATIVKGQQILIRLGELQKMAVVSPRSVLDLIERDFPTIFKLGYPRRYDIPAGFSSPKIFAYVLFFTLWDVSTSDRIKETRIHARFDTTLIYRSWFGLRRLATPTYFVKRDLLVGLINTDLPKDLCLEDFTWPMESMLLMLPDGVVSSPRGDITMILVSRIEAGAYNFNEKIWEVPHFNDTVYFPEIKQEEPKLGIVGFTKQGIAYQWEGPLKGSLPGIVKTPAVECNLADYSLQLSMYMENEVIPDAETEHQTTSNIAEVAFQIILGMLACPEMVEGGVCIREAKEKKGKCQEEMWSPNFFGRAYKRPEAILGDTDGESKGHMRTHWRRGHFRHQRYGPGNKALKVIWIPRKLVNAPFTETGT